MAEELIPITEEMNLHEQWYKDARNQTIDTIGEFTRHLMEDYRHDYGTVCHAIAASMMATMYAANDTEYSITGFQASQVMWEVIKHMIFTTNQIGLRIIDYDKMLYPQYESFFTDRKITKEQFEMLQKVAKEKLELDRDGMHPKVVKHLESIVDGKVPFGYTIKEEL